MCQNQHFYQLINNHDARGASWGSLTPSVTGSEIGTKEARCLDGIRVEFLALDPRVKPEDDSARGASWGSLAPLTYLWLALCHKSHNARHSASIGYLESHDRANGRYVETVAAVGSIVGFHIERTSRLGEEAPRVVTGKLRRRPNALIVINFVASMKIS